jgi:cytoskeletal protein RodZ
MKIFAGIMLLPLFCLFVIIITGVLIWIVLKRSDRTMQQVMEKQVEKQAEKEAEKQAANPRTDSSASANTRWARGDLKSTSGRLPSGGMPIICPACGAENPAGEKICQSCGQEL